MRKISSILMLLLMCQTHIPCLLAQEFSECVTKTQRPGVCRKFHSCSSLLNAIQNNQLNINENTVVPRCGYVDNIPIVCCPTDFAQNQPVVYSNPAQYAFTGSRAKDACREYARYINPLANYILNGQASNLGDYPYMVAIGRFDGIRSRREYEWFCGGSLISKNYVLTAGHCVAGRDNIPEVVRLNDVNLAEDVASDITIYVERSIRHPNYVTSLKYDDIGLIKLARDVPFSTTVHPICLATESSIRPGSIMRAVGFGITEAEERSNILLKTQLTVTNKNTCYRSFSGPNVERVLPDKIRSTQFCANDPKGKSNTCQGDSGGALELKLNGQHTIFGITSFGTNDCNGAKIPTVYTRVLSYLDWIENIVW